MLKLPAIAGVIDWRILANWRVDPLALQPYLPQGFKPRLVDGHAIAGICIIALQHARPRWMPRFTGFASINAAHRVAVVWDRDDGSEAQGVMVLRRDTSSRITAWTGGRVFPTFHNLSRFQFERRDANTENDAITFSLSTRDGAGNVSLKGHVAERTPATSVFADLDETSAFFEQDKLGLSPLRAGNEARALCDCSSLEGIELRIDDWQASAFEVTEIASSIFGGEERDQSELWIPPSACEFDHALLMRNIPHEWHGVKREAFTPAAQAR